MSFSSISIAGLFHHTAATFYLKLFIGASLGSVERHWGGRVPLDHHCINFPLGLDSTYLPCND